MFRINAQQLFFTYPQCTLTREQCLEQLTNKIKSKNNDISEYVVCKEEHENGDPHLHVYLKLAKKINIRNANFFDLKHDNEDKSFHGNYQTARNAKAVQNYVKKDGNFISNISNDQLGLVKNVYVQAIDMVKENGDLDGAVELLSKDKRGARDVVLHLESIEKSLGKFVPSKKEPINLSLEEFKWVDGYWDRKTTLILYGPTNTGKTTLANLLLPDATLISHIDGLKNIKRNQFKNGIIFDDMSFLQWPDEAQIHLLDNDFDRQIHCRFVCATIPAGTPKIITSNKDPDLIVHYSNGAIKRRCTVAKIPERGELEFPDEWN